MRVLLLIMLLMIPSVSALEGSLPLLAVSETAEGLRGSVATLDVEIREGKGRVFLETRPVTKVDTQISMRFAQQIACERAEMDCSEYDFIYTITAESGIVGGPSAGAAATALTYAVLTGEELRKDVAITGTINSGGLIGTVGGLPQKIEAGSERFKIILLPQGTRYTEDMNQTIDLVKYGAQFGVVTEEVSDIDEVLTILTGKQPKPLPEFRADPAYTALMRNVSTDLCTRSEQLQEAFYYEEFIPLNISVLDVENRTLELLERGQNAIVEGDYYSAASFCYRSSVNYAWLRYQAGNFSKQELDIKLKMLNQGIRKFRQAVDEQDIRTITQLQSSIVVLDRLAEADRYLQRAKSGRDGDISYPLSFATERLHSATSWSKFYGMPGAQYDVDETKLRRSCDEKIQEAQERYQYVQFYIPNSLGTVRDQIQLAMELQEDKDYAFCLFTAAQAKAQANVIVGVIGANHGQLGEIIENKLAAVEKVLARSQQKGFFPIIGYSYYQYASSLKDSDQSSALLFAEYALELSSLDLYFPPKQRKTWNLDTAYLLFLVGIVLGSVLSRFRAKS